MQAYLKYRMCSTNNAIEGSNRVIKDDFTGHIKLPLNELIFKFRKYVENCTRFQQKNNYVKFPFIDNVTRTIAKYLNEYFEEISKI